jgi:hypothetical protein
MPRGGKVVETMLGHDVEAWYIRRRLIVRKFIFQVL